MASLAAPPVFHLAEQAGPRLTLRAAGGETAHIFVLDHHVIRVMVLPQGRLASPRTWAVAPGDDDTPPEGRDRFDLTGFPCPGYDLKIDDADMVVATKALRLTVKWRHLRCQWAMNVGEAWIDIAADRATQAYDFGWWDGKPRHYLSRRPGEAYYGLGERAGPMDRAGRRYRLSNLDAMGYDAETSDPLYKHIPFYLTRVSDRGESFGLFYDTLADCVFDFGCELDNYHGPYRGFEAEGADLDYYVIAGPTPLEVTQRFTWLTGKPARLPRWCLGYSGSGMAYADDPTPLTRMEGFIAGCVAHDIPCASFHLSSGYTLKEGRRYVFEWNRQTFPDPAALARTFADKGLKVLANVKPCLLTDHPRFAEAAAQGLFIRGEGGEPDLAQFWDGLGAYLDFTNPATARWWKDALTRTVLDQGIAGVWNDNNEFEVRSPSAHVFGFGASARAISAKPLQSLLMMRASRDAQLARAPTLRPMGVSRAGAVGLHRYVQTWSGDNTTHWKTPRWNSRMGQGLALSGVSNFGHDIGGFAGPAPGPELFARWAAAGIFLPRFSIHSWNDDGSVNEPWMHPEALCAVRALLALRHRFEPFLDEQLRRYAEDSAPTVRALFLNFPDDPAAWRQEDVFMIGSDLLTAPALDPGVGEVSLTLPAGAAWRDYGTGALMDGGAVVSLAAPWAQPPVLIRAGAVLPLDLSPAGFSRSAPVRGAWLATPARGRFEGHWTEDDGVSLSRESEVPWRVTGEAGSDEVAVTIIGPAGEPITLVTPLAETRPLRVTGAEALGATERDGEVWTRVRVVGNAAA
jgi:alpha-glucosidase